MAKKGIDLEVVKIEDVVTPNTGLVEGSLNANFFQHQPYLDDFNKENNADLVSIGKVHYEPFGIYAGKVTSLDKVEGRCRYSGDCTRHYRESEKYYLQGN